MQSNLRFKIISISIALQFSTDKHKESSKCLLEAKQYIEWLIKFAIKYFTIAFPVCQFVQLLGSAIYSYMAYGYFNNDILYRPFKLAYDKRISKAIKRKFNFNVGFFSFRLFWNTNTFSGWIAEASLSLCITISFLFSNPSFLLFFVSICEYHGTFYKMFRTQCVEIGTIARDKSHGNYYEVKKCIHETIIFHNMVKK